MKKKLAPKRKVASGGFAAALATVVIWILEAQGIEVPGQVGSALGGIVSFGTAYFVPEK
jgi:putative flippase GtrA